MMLVGKLMYSLMIIIIIIGTVNGNCLVDEKKRNYQAFTITDTSVNAEPGTMTYHCILMYNYY